MGNLVLLIMERDYDKIKLILQTLTACVLLTIAACYFRAPFEGFMAAYTLAVTVAFYLYTAGVLTQIQQENALKTSSFSKYNEYRWDTLVEFGKRLIELEEKYWLPPITFKASKRKITILAIFIYTKK